MRLGIIAGLLLTASVASAQPVTVNGQPGYSLPLTIASPTPTATATATPTPTPTSTPTPSPTPTPTPCMSITNTQTTVSGTVAVTTTDTCSGRWFEALYVDANHVGDFDIGHVQLNTTKYSNGPHVVTVTSQSKNPGSQQLGSSTVQWTFANGQPTPTPTATPSAELRPDNVVANGTPAPVAFMDAYQQLITEQSGAGCTSGICEMTQANALLVDGAFTGTTTDILLNYAAKYGIDPNLVQADADMESHWHQSAIGDIGNGVSLGILQIKSRDYPESCPTVAKSQNPADVNAPDCMSHLSTPFATDYRLMEWENCLNGGAAAYVGAHGRDHSTEGYPTAVKNQDQTLQTGCLGMWFSGSFMDSSGVNYAQQVQAIAVQQPWTKPGF